MFQKIIVKYFLFAVPAVALAQTPITSAGDVTRVISNVATFLFTSLMAVSVIVFIVAGFMYLTAGGNEQKVETATQAITYGVVGIVVAVFAYAIPKLIQAIIS